MLCEVKNVMQFILGGNSKFVIVHNSAQCAYNIYRKKTKDNSKVFRVYVYSSNRRLYTGYFKVVGNVLKYKHNTEFDGVPENDERVTLLLRAIHNRNNPGADTKVYHTGKCGKCGRRLTDPKSIERGFGSDCYKMMKECLHK